MVYSDSNFLEAVVYLENINVVLKLDRVIYIVIFHFSLIRILEV